MTQVHNTDSSIFYSLDFEKLITKGVSNLISDFVINDIAKDIRFVSLESSERAWFRGVNLNLVKSKGSFIISDISNINIYDTVGVFVKNIAKFGGASNELPSMLRCILENSNLERLCAVTERKIVVHTFDGKYIDKIILKKGTPSFGAISLLNSGDYVFVPPFYQITGDEKMPYLFFINGESKTVSSKYYKNERELEQNKMTERNQDWRINLERNNLVSNFSGDALFRDLFNDTVYTIKDKNDIVKYMALHRGKLMPTPKDSYNLGKNMGKIYFSEIAETEKYVIVKYFYDRDIFTSIWSKKDETVIANIGIDKEIKQEGLSYEFLTRYRTPKFTEILVNILLATEDKLYCLVEAKKAMTFLADLEEDDNYVIMIVDLK